MCTHLRLLCTFHQSQLAIAGRRAPRAQQQQQQQQRPRRPDALEVPNRAGAREHRGGTRRRQQQRRRGQACEPPRPEPSSCVGRRGQQRGWGRRRSDDGAQAAVRVERGCSPQRRRRWRGDREQIAPSAWHVRSGFVWVRLVCHGCGVFGQWGPREEGLCVRGSWLVERVGVDLSRKARGGQVGGGRDVAHGMSLFVEMLLVGRFL